MKGDIDKDLAQENLKRISANFELELLRLIKTLNLISQSKELYKGQITFIQALTDRYKLRLSDFTIRLLDMERKSHEVSLAQDTENLFTPHKESSLSPAAVIEVINEIRTYFNEISTEIESNKNDYLNKLDSIYAVYNLQLGASQTDLDLKLRELQREISRVSDSNGSGGSEKDKAADITQIDYVKPTLQQPETLKPKERRIDYIGPDEPKTQVPHKPAAQATPNAKAKTETKTGAKAAGEEEEKDTKIKNSYVIGAGLLILGIIVGVLFYDMLMRMWGVEDVSVVDTKTYSPPGSKGVQKAPAPPAAKKEAKAPAAPDSGTEKAKEDNNLFPMTKPQQQADAEKPSKPVETVTDQVQPKAEKETSSAPPVESDQSKQIATPGAQVSYTVIGVGANVRNGPGMGNDIVTVVNEGDVFKGLGEQSGRWVKILAPDGKEGWISTKVVRVVE